jgi:HEAT repeat protein
MEKALTSQIVDVRRSAVAVLDSVNGAPSDLGRIQDPAARKQDRAAMLDSVGGEQALLLLEKALADPDRSVQLAAFGALSRLGGTKTLALQEKALPLLERALADPERLMGLNAAKLLAGLGGAKALALLEKALPLLEEAQIATNDTVRGEAMSVRASLGDKGIPLIEKALGAEAFDVRRDAAQGLGNVSMEKALPLIAKALADPNARVRSAAFFGFASRSRADMEKALPLLEKALADPDGLVRQCAIGELGRMGGEKARDLLLGRLAAEKDAGLLRMIRSVLQERFPGAPETR